MYMSQCHRDHGISSVAVTVSGQYGAQVGITGGYTGWVIRVHYRPSRFARGECCDSEAGPVGPSRAGVGGHSARANGAVYAALGPPTPARPGLPGPAPLSQAC